jgi:hypothetical protein
VAYLISGAIFRPDYVASGPSSISQDICSLGELVDMYNTHEASERHDKIYALLGMSSDDASKANLLPDYTVPWKDLFQRLVKFLICENISVETWNDKEIAVIKSKGCILGKVSSVQSGIASNGGQDLNITFNNTSKQSKDGGERSSQWSLHSSAKSIQSEDLICLLQGSSKPTIIRLCKDYFAVIMIGATPLRSTETESENINWPNLVQLTTKFTRDFLLVWDWERIQGKLQDQEYDKLLNSRRTEQGEMELEGHLDIATRPWNVALILEDLEDHEMAQKKYYEAKVGLERAIGAKHPHEPQSQCIQTPLSWAAGNGYNALVKLMLAKDDFDPDLKESQSGLTPLSRASQEGHDAEVKLLLETGKVKVNSKDHYGRTPLWWAAEGGYEAVIKLLLKTGQVDVDSKDHYGQTPLSLAAQGGHEAVIKLLLETGKVDVNFRYKDGQTLLVWAAQGGRNAMVKLLLETGKADVNFEDKNGRTPLW